MATNQIEYQGYIAAVEIDREANLLRATVINLDTAVLSACGRTVAELEESLSKTVEIYRSDCEADGVEAELPKVIAHLSGAGRV